MNIYLNGFPPHSSYHYLHRKHPQLNQPPDLSKVMSRQ
ncbi:BgTH12-04161 [Blumeria graminis f. sp. triticale]|uniref:BgTH12-04161 n=1 Tax=Blumeria graminis f. sp. triticale TaxID=1689686 RepID=A0A9W4CX05_BLUGR|nr:BgTH12-04161 [Blumeria graminis f. sp. triticale]